MIEVVIVGFGFSAVPLVRELEASGTSYTVISSDFASIWDGLERSGRLDFDLVSSYLTSFYSFDLVEMFAKDGYPTAAEYFARQKKWRAFYGDRIVHDDVVRVENFADHSVVHTKSGARIESRHVVFATGFGRSITTELNHLDYQAPMDTVVFDTMGDSVNLMVSHLVANGVKVIIRTNGFHARDKVVPVFGKTYTLDQLEFQNYRYVSHDHYGSVIYGTPLGSANPYLMGDQFPVSLRDESFNKSRSRPVNGAVAIKYWPIDEYERLFGADLESAITSGYVLNDIAMWLHTGRVIVVPKDTPIDFESKTITYGGVTRGFDLYVKGDAEAPRLPTIVTEAGDEYAYVQRETFMGVIPERLHNIYLMGYTRPYTGGLVNVVEMQALLVHKLITQPQFHDRIHDNLGQRIEAYNRHYFPYEQPKRYEHLVYYGFYTDEIARLLGIEHRPGDCESLADLLFYYAFPNNAFKYRLRGEYAVPGVRELIAKINRQHEYFLVPLAYVLCSALKSDEDLEAWLPKVGRNFFNDMRHKDNHRTFLDTYLEAYRKVKKATGAYSPEAGWDAMVAQAAETRDQMVPHVTSSPPYAADEDFAREVQLLGSWFVAGGALSEGELAKLGEEHAALIRTMLAPPEYDLEFLRD